MNKKCLIVAAHPDDEVLGCFGTAAKLIRQGWSVHTLILSGGKTSRGAVNPQEIELLRNEMHQANALIGVSGVSQADFPDNAFDSVPLLEIVKRIEQEISEIKPEMIFTHHIGDMNIDHQITHKAVLTATRPMKNETVRAIYSMEIPSSTEWNSFNPGTAFIPNVFSDISETVDLKVRSMALYQSELRDYPHPRSLQHIKELAKVNGTKVGLEYSENFMLVRRIYD